MTGPIDPCVLTEPCWLEEYLDEQGVADQDWTREIPTPVIAVVQAMHRAGATDADIAAHFAAARQWRAEHRDRDRGVPCPDGMEDEFGDLPGATALGALPVGLFPVYPLGGLWEPTPDAIAQVLDATGRRERRVVSRPLQIARQRLPEDQPVLFDLTEAS